MTVIQVGCSQLGLANWVQQIVTGGIIVVAVAIDRVRSTRLDVRTSRSRTPGRPVTDPTRPDCD